MRRFIFSRFVFQICRGREPTWWSGWGIFVKLYKMGRWEVILDAFFFLLLVACKCIRITFNNIKIIKLLFIRYKCVLDLGKVILLLTQLLLKQPHG